MAAYPLHDGGIGEADASDSERKMLKNYWASWSSCLKEQPLDHIR